MELFGLESSKLRWREDVASMRVFGHSEKGTTKRRAKIMDAQMEGIDIGSQENQNEWKPSPLAGTLSLGRQRGV